MNVSEVTDKLFAAKRQKNLSFADLELLEQPSCLVAAAGAEISVRDAR